MDLAGHWHRLFEDRGRSTSVDPPAGPDGCEAHGGRAANDLSKKVAIEVKPQLIQLLIAWAWR
jgi:hypothetical protein